MYSLLALAAVILQPGVSADSHTYSSVRRQIRAGILISSAFQTSTGVRDNPDPHVFYIADSRLDLKPLGLDFVNPLAPSVISADIYARWQARNISGGDYAFIPARPESRLFQLGSKVTKSMGAYWEVNLDTSSSDDLRKFDLLYLHVSPFLSPTQIPGELRDKLRKFVDSGGTLWVENPERLVFDNNTSFLFDVNFHGGVNSSSGLSLGDTNHPLLSSPFVLTAQEVSGLGDKRANDYYLFRSNILDASNYGPGDNDVNPPGAGSLVPVVWNTRGFANGSLNVPNPNWRPYILAGPMGSGRAVFSCQNSGGAINHYCGTSDAGYGANTGAISGSQFQGANPSDLKFLYNLSIWSSAHQSANTSDRRSGYTQDKVGAALDQKWLFASSPGGIARIGGPVIYKGCAFVVDSNLILHCFNLTPGQDLDGDGNPDDGLPDLITGLPYDQVWQVDLKQLPEASGAVGCSTPTVIEFYDPTFGSTSGAGGLTHFNNREQVIIVFSNGNAVALTAFPRLATGQLAPLSASTPALASAVKEWSFNLGAQAAPFDLSNPLAQVPSAAYSEGVVYLTVSLASGVANFGGRLVAIDPHNGASAFKLDEPPAPDTVASVSGASGQGMIPSIPGVPAPMSGVSLGYVTDKATGAIDRLAYVHFQRLTVGMAQNLPDTIRTFPIGSRGEVLTRQGATTTFISRSTGSFPAAPWYIVDPANPGTNNRIFQQRLYARYPNPMGGNDYNMELTYDAGGTAANSYSYVYVAGQPVRITLVNNLTFAGGPTIPSTDDKLVVSADYVLDWSSATATRVNARTSLTVPDVGGNGNLVSGPPSLGPDDTLYYGVDTTPGSGSNNGRGVLFAVSEQGTNRTNVKWSYSLHNGMQIVYNQTETLTIPPRLRSTDLGTNLLLPSANFGRYITDVQLRGTPAVRDDVVYVSAVGSLAGTPVSLVLAFRANPDIVLRLGSPIPTGVGVSIRQPNPVTSQGSVPNFVPINQQQYTIDSGTGTIRINAMAAPGSANAFAATNIPFFVKVGTNPEVAVFGEQTDTITNPVSRVIIGTEKRIAGPDSVDNLLWFAVIPAGPAPVSSPIFGDAVGGLGLVTSSPSIQGDVIWLSFENGFILSMDADPGATDPAAQVNGAQVALVDASLALKHVRWVQRVSIPGLPVIAPPVGTADVLVASSQSGIIAFEDARTLIADNHRLIEVNAAGDALWSSDGSRAFGVAGGELPQYVFDPGSGTVGIGNPVSGTGSVVAHTVQWARPEVARHIGVNELMVVDTGNNRVVQIDRGGNVIWEINRVFDDFKGVGRPGDPLSLNEPTDCQFWTEFTPNINQWFAANAPGYTYGAVPGFVIHYLIADTGNFRVIEVIDMYDAGGRAVVPNIGGSPAKFSMLRQMHFATATYTTQGKRYRYRSLQRVLMRNKDLPASWQDGTKGANEAVRLTIAIIQNFRLVGDPLIPKLAVNAFGETEEGPGGSVVVLSEAGKPLSVVSNLSIPNGMGGVTVQPIVGPTWLSLFQELDGSGNVTYKYLLADSNGCYQMKPGSIPDRMDVEWLITNDDYYYMTGKKLAAANIQRLGRAVSAGPNLGLHHFLISNRFTGVDNPASFGITYNLDQTQPTLGNISGNNDFHGEVVQIDPTLFAFGGAFHGYARDYVANGNFLVKNPLASITWRSPNEALPTPNLQVNRIDRTIGRTDQGTSAAKLDQPTFADRPF